MVSEELAQGTSQMGGEYGGFVMPQLANTVVDRWDWPEGFS